MLPKMKLLLLLKFDRPLLKKENENVSQKMKVTSTFFFFSWKYQEVTIIVHCQFVIFLTISFLPQTTSLSKSIAQLTLEVSATFFT